MPTQPRYNRNRSCLQNILRLFLLSSCSKSGASCYHLWMYYILLLTERCNLNCVYCENEASRSLREHQDAEYSIDTLIDFLSRDPDLGIQFYGGEPLLRVDMVEEILARLTPKRVSLQTNGFFLDKLSDAALKKIQVIPVSVDGPQKVTDGMRGVGVYSHVIKQVQKIRERGFEGSIDARMTASAGMDIFKAVTHLLTNDEFQFDNVHWQLNVLFGKKPHQKEYEFIPSK